MANWKNLDTLDSFKALSEEKSRANIVEDMADEGGADRVKKYTVKMAEGLNRLFIFN